MADIHDRVTGVVVRQGAEHDHTKQNGNFCPACVHKAMSDAGPRRHETDQEGHLREKREDDRREWYE